MSVLAKHEILLVDDDEAIRDSFGSVLRRAGYDVSVAENGFVALLQLRSGVLALISPECGDRRPAENPRDTLSVLPKHRPLYHRFFSFDCFSPARSGGGSNHSRADGGGGKSVARLAGYLPLAGRS
jgi:hypothetical protein